MEVTTRDARCAGKKPAAIDTTGIVEFRATHDQGVQTERSHFLREGGRWFYVDGVAQR